MTTTAGRRIHSLHERARAWAEASPVRRAWVRAVITIVGPILVLAGVAMLVLPGPGLVVIGLGFTLLAGEYAWARRIVGAGARGVVRGRDLLFPRGGSPARKAAGVLVAGAAVVGSTAATAAVTALLGAQAVL